VNFLPSPSKFRTLLILGARFQRAHPLVHCLAGWWLGGGGGGWQWVRLVVAMTLLYLGGMFLKRRF